MRRERKFLHRHPVQQAYIVREVNHIGRTKRWASEAQSIAPAARFDEVKPAIQPPS